MSRQASDPLNFLSGDKLAFAVFIGAALHVMLVFGLSFKPPEPKESARSLAVTLVTHRSESEPERSDYLAQSNQQASGSEEDKMLPTTTKVSPFAGPQEAAPRPPQQRQGDPAEQRQALAAKSDQKVPESSRESPDEGQDDNNIAPQTDAQSLMAQLDTLRQEYARRPRTATLTSVAASASEDAAYQMMLQNRIVDVGNRHYPEEALEERIFGSVRLQLEIAPDGHIADAEILESSGHLVLDRAAVDIARKAGPFPEFPSELRNKYDRVVFIRSWQFLPGGALRTE